MSHRNAGQAPALDAVLPTELRALHQWVAWKYVADVGRPKPRKVPVSPNTLSNASSTNPGTWGTFDAALACASEHALAGVGFVFSADDPYCGIDLDKCIQETGTPDEYAANIVEEMGSYTELSPSGTGLHIIVRASLPGGKGRKTDKVEIYDRGRFFTVTGHPVGSPVSVVAERQASVDNLYRSLRPRTAEVPPVRPDRLLVGPELPDDTVVDLMLAADAKQRFRTLFKGQWGSRHGSASEADLALVGMLANFVGNNPAQIDRLFRRSKLFRPKWDELRGTKTYGELTILKALGGENG